MKNYRDYSFIIACRKPTDAGRDKIAKILSRGGWVKIKKGNSSNRCRELGQEVMKISGEKKRPSYRGSRTDVTRKKKEKEVEH